MLIHHHSKPLIPSRVVVIGAGGFVGGAIVRQMGLDNILTMGLTRKEVDLLQPDAVDKLKGILQPTDSVVVVSAIAPAKTVTMLMDNLRMVEAVCEALASMPIYHLVYISSDARLHRRCQSGKGRFTKGSHNHAWHDACCSGTHACSLHCGSGGSFATNPYLWSG